MGKSFARVLQILYGGKMITSYSRGHKIYYDGAIWRYSDNNQPHDDSRTCKKCGRFPTKEGYDACLGYIEGATSVCCGHGISTPILMFKEV